MIRTVRLQCLKPPFLALISKFSARPNLWFFMAPSFDQMVDDINHEVQKLAEEINTPRLNMYTQEACPGITTEEFKDSVAKPILYTGRAPCVQLKTISCQLPLPEPNIGTEPRFMRYMTGRKGNLKLLQTGRNIEFGRQEPKKNVLNNPSAVDFYGPDISQALVMLVPTLTFGKRSSAWMLRTGEGLFEVSEILRNHCAKQINHLFQVKAGLKAVGVSCPPICLSIPLSYPTTSTCLQKDRNGPVSYFSVSGETLLKSAAISSQGCSLTFAKMPNTSVNLHHCTMPQERGVAVLGGQNELIIKLPDFPSPSMTIIMTGGLLSASNANLRRKYFRSDPHLVLKTTAQINISATM